MSDCIDAVLFVGVRMDKILRKETKTYKKTQYNQDTGVPYECTFNEVINNIGSKIIPYYEVYSQYYFESNFGISLIKITSGHDVLGFYIRSTEEDNQLVEVSIEEIQEKKTLVKKILKEKFDMDVEPVVYMSILLSH